jgi:hypothetical protein
MNTMILRHASVLDRIDHRLADSDRDTLHAARDEITRLQGMLRVRSRLLADIFHCNAGHDLPPDIKQRIEECMRNLS